MGRKNQKKEKIILPPELPPEVTEDEIEVSDEDLQFVNENLDYAGFVSKLDTQSITRHVTRVADVKEDDLESIYEKRLRKKLLQEGKKENGIEIDPVDALPVKTLEGKLYYRTEPKTSKNSENEPGEDEETGENDAGADKSLMKLSKPERRAKLKKLKKEAKKQGKEAPKPDELPQPTQIEVLAEVKNDLTAEEANEKRKYRLAELGMELLTNPESNIKSLKEMLQICKEGDHAIVILGLKSLLAVFKDIIPGYRIRLPTEKEQEMMVSKTVKRMRFYESTLLVVYKAYLHKLIEFEKKASYCRVAIRCMCTLLEAVPHFNFRKDLLASVVKNISSSDDVIRKLCCSAVKSLFFNEGKHGGEATVEAVQLIADLVKVNNCHLHPDSIEVFMSLSFDEDLGRPEKSEADNKVMKHKKFSKRKNGEYPNGVQDNDRKKSRKELISKTREEVNADIKAASFAQDVAERRKMQSETLSAVFQTYFRILKHAMQQTAANKSGVSSKSAVCASLGHPLLAPCLDGIGKFAHLIDLDFMSDLLNYLRNLAGGGRDLDSSPENELKYLTVSERLRCCIVAFKVMRNNLDALNIDLKDFFVQLYNLILEYRPGRDQGEVLAEALKIMLCDDRQHDMQRAAAFIKRLATSSLCLGSAESLAALITVRNLLQRNVKCRNLLENDAGGGSVSGPIAKYQPYADPHLSGALASVLWELNLLSHHYHPAIASMASSISSMNTAANQVQHRAGVSPQQAYKELSLERDETFKPRDDTRSSTTKRKRVSVPSQDGSSLLVPDLDVTNQVDEDNIRMKLIENFLLLRDITENERLRGELDRTSLSLKLYEQYKKQKKKRKNEGSKIIKKVKQN